MGNPVSSLSRVTVYKRGWRSPREIEVAGIVASWGVSTPGQFSAILPIRGQSLTGVDWLGCWIWWEHPTMGVWAGTVEDRPKRGADGTMELSAYGFGLTLDRVTTIRRYRPASGPPGAIITRALADVTLDAGMPYTVNASERGPQLTYEFRGDSVLSVFDELVSASGQEWTALMNDARTLEIVWRGQVGRDETQRVVFTEGVNIIDADSDMTLAGMTNDINAIADDQQYNRAAGARVQARGSIGRFGRRKRTIQYKGLVAKSTLGPRAQRDIKRLSLPTTTVVLRVPHTEPKLQYVRDGTQIRLVSWMDNAVYRLRVLDRTVDLDAGVVTLTCDAVSDITRAAQETFYGWGGIPTQPGA